MVNNETVQSSLEGVIIGETSISKVDGLRGQLTYRGQAIADLIDTPYWQIASLLACERTPTGQQQRLFDEFMRRNSALSDPDLTLLHSLPMGLHPMLMLQTVLAALPEMADTEVGLPLVAPDIAHGYALAAKIPALLCAWRQREAGGSGRILPRQGDPAADFLSSFSGATNNPLSAKLLNACQVLQMEHSYNASTFAGRVCASTNAPIQSVLSVSVGTLYGPLHGGADQAALEMAQNLGSPAGAALFVQQQLANKNKIMGMGHREYKVLDPRAALLKPMAAELCAGNAQSEQLFATLIAVEQACQTEFATKNKRIWANVEYYKGAVFHAMGIPSHYFTALFAMARVFGYLAHYEEFRQQATLIRPTARYVGR